MAGDAPPPYPAGVPSDDVSNCKKAQACFPFWPLVGILLFLGGQVVIFLGAVRFLDAVAMYETAVTWAVETASSPFDSPAVIYTVVIAALIILLELALFYSAWSHALRLANTHCCKNKEFYRACGGSEDRAKEEKCSLLCLELFCIAYNHFLVLCAWAGVIVLIVQTALGAVVGTVIVTIAGMCYISLDTLAAVAEQLNSPPISAGLNISIVQLNSTLCADPIQLAESGGWLTAGPCITLFSQVILLVCYVAVWKAHSHHTTHVNKQAEKMASTFEMSAA